MDFFASNKIIDSHIGYNPGKSAGESSWCLGCRVQSVYHRPTATGEDVGSQCVWL